MNLITGNIGFGCVGLSAQPTIKKALALLNNAYDLGITHFDTAPIYGNGYSEKILGLFLASKKNKISISTKFGLSASPIKNIPISLALPLNYLRKKVKPNKSVNSLFHKPEILSFRSINKEEIKSSFEMSLKNLRSEHINIYLLHEAVPEFLTDEAIRYLAELKNKNFVDKLGIACSYVNLDSLNVSKLLEWEILQYENGENYPSDFILNKFPDKIHFHHSSLKFIKDFKNEKYSSDEIAGMILSKSIKQNPSGKILFSTSKVKTLINNIQNLKKYEGYTISELDKMLSVAIH